MNIENEQKRLGILSQEDLNGLAFDSQLRLSAFEGELSASAAYNPEAMICNQLSTDIEKYWAQEDLEMHIRRTEKSAEKLAGFYKQIEEIISNVKTTESLKQKKPSVQSILEMMDKRPVVQMKKPKKISGFKEQIQKLMNPKK